MHAVNWLVSYTEPARIAEAFRVLDEADALVQLGAAGACWRPLIAPAASEDRLDVLLEPVDPHEIDPRIFVVRELPIPNESVVAE